jgi:hypothetical protein
LRTTPPLRVTALCLAALVTTLAGCGSAEDDQATAPSTTATTVTTTATPGTSPTSSTTPRASSRGGSPKLASPDAPPTTLPDPPAVKGNELAPASPADKLVVTSPSGGPKWRVAAQLKDTGDDAFCLTVTSIGDDTPTPDCSSGTETALNLIGSQATAEADADVDSVMRSDRNKASDLLVTGVATDAVQKVVVKYAGHTYTAQLSSSVAEVNINASLAAAILGSEAKRLPSSLGVRLFGVSFPMTNGNPPQTARPAHKHPRDGVMTFSLQ